MENQVSKQKEATCADRIDMVLMDDAVKTTKLVSFSFHCLLTYFLSAECLMAKSLSIPDFISMYSCLFPLLCLLIQHLPIYNLALSSAV